MITIREVAEKAGVSVTTVSRVLNKRGYISQNTYDKVYNAIAELNYQPNQLARSLSKQKTHLIGMVIPDISHPFYALLTQKIEACLYQKGYKLLLCNAEGAVNREHNALIMLRQNKVDGIIIGSHLLNVDEYEKLELPIVGIDIYLSDSIPSIYCNHIKGGALAAGKFIENQCRCVLLIRGSGDAQSPYLSRHSTLISILKEHNIDYISCELKEHEFKRDHYYEIVYQLLLERPDIDGIFAVDTIAVYAVKAAFNLGISIPEQLKIIGYDGTDIARMIHPNLTYIQQPMSQLADVIVDTLIAKINGEVITDDIILENVELIEGNTTC